jgi:curved DNA-binding protein
LSLEEAFRGGERSIHVQAPELAADGNLVTRNRSLSVRIPAGVTDGQQIRLRGQGEPAPGGGTPGDLYLEVELKPHRLFALDGKNVLLRLPVAPWEAALGATVKVPTLGGTVSLKIPPNAKAGQKLRLKGRGLPGPTAGDQIVELQLVLPEVRGPKEKELLGKLAEVLAFDPRADLEP